MKIPKNILKKIRDSLFTINIHQKVIINDKEVDPKSKEGKKAIEEMNKAFDDMDEAFKEMEKHFSKTFK